MKWQMTDAIKRRLVACVTLFLGACGGGGDAALTSTAGSTDITVPTAMATSLRFTDLALGLQHACGLTASGEVYCWGSNEYNQLGTAGPLSTCDMGATPCSPTPVRVVASGVVFKSVAASLRTSCALSTVGEIWCWGFGIGGQLGDGLGRNSAVPVKVASAVTFQSVSLGNAGFIICAVGSTGEGYCWGPGGGAGGLGNGTTAGSNTPSPVSGGLLFSQFTVGDDHACGLTTSGAAYCWGNNGFGKLGAGPAAGSSSVPVLVAGGHQYTMLSAGLDHTCGLASDGTAYCWGFPQAVGTTVSGGAFSPMPVSAGMRFLAISAGGNHTCGLDPSGQAWCWGQNFGGELGDGTLTTRVAPVPVSSSERFVNIRAGGSTCALNSAGVAFCWGSNLDGELGQVP